MAEQSARYSTIAIVLHWIIAALILLNLSIGFFMESLSPELRSQTVDVHTSAGITVLLLTVVRIVWRLIHRPPAFHSRLSRGERVVAHGVHVALYVMMILMPLSGWALTSAHPPPGGRIANERTLTDQNNATATNISAAGAATSRRGQNKIWWLIPLPKLGFIQQMGVTPDGVARQKALHDTLVARHGQGALMMIALLLLHIGGALKHQYLDGYDELARISFPRRRGGVPL